MTSRDPKERWLVQPGREAHREGVRPDGRGGTVVVRVGDRLQISAAGKDEPSDDYRDAIFIRYDGPDAERSCWLQFLWVEVLVEDASGAVTRVPGKTPATSAHDEIELTLDPRAQNVYVDSASDDSPCYEADTKVTFEHNSGRNGIWDRPDAHIPLALAASHVGPNTRFVTSVFHFTNYLVIDGAVVYFVTWRAQARWDLLLHSSSDSVPVEIVFESAGRGGVLTRAERDALDREYPDQDELP